MIRAAAIITGGLLLTGCVSINVVHRDAGSSAESPTSSATPVVPQHQLNSPWYRDASARVQRADAGSGARNVVLFIGDGMGISTITASRILQGQRAGQFGEENRLSFEEFPVTGLVKTYNTNSQTADSAGTMSAIVTGVKTDIGVFGVDEHVTRGNCASTRGRELVSLLDIAELAGRATGVVTTTRITHATPAATYAKTPNRDWEDDSDLAEGAANEGCTDIARQLLDHRQRMNDQFGNGASDGIEVAMGGGRRHFLPKSVDGGRRADEANLVEEWRALYAEGSYVDNADDLDGVANAPLLGLFSASHMGYAHQRSMQTEQPSLKAMTLKALELLERERLGYFLVVEAGRIDHAHHAGNAANALNETIELSDTVAAVMERINRDNTLVLVTADHSHVFTIAGYPRRGNPILGKVIPAWSDQPLLDETGKPYTTLGYMNGRGFRDYGDERDADITYREPPNTGRKDLTAVNTTALGYHQEALIPLNSETHGGEDVAVYATGPGAGALSGVLEQNVLFHAMIAATGWDRAAAERVENLAR